MFTQISGSEQINAEVELGVVIGRRGKRISEDEATEYIGGYCLALDLTNITLLVGEVPSPSPSQRLI